jgi:bacillithiol biosynthesis deacetylase BshB1
MPVEILLVGAHPDDVEWGLGGTALLLRDKGISFAIFDLTRGEMGSRGTADQRAVEAAAAANFMGAASRENAGLPDCGLVDSMENRRAIPSAVRRHKPRIVIAPWWEDRHPDHAAAGLIVRNSRLLCGLSALDDANPPHKPAAFLYYPIHQFQPPTLVIDTSDVFERKLELLRTFESQFGEGIEGDFLLRLEARDRYYGSLIGVRYGEPLVAHQPIPLGGIDSLLRLFR